MVVLLRLFTEKILLSVFERFRLLLLILDSFGIFSALLIFAGPEISIEYFWPTSPLHVTVSLARIMAELFFGIPQMQHISLNLVFVEGEVGEGSGEMEEEFVENLGKQCIGV